MAHLVLEGTWEEIAAHADAFVGKRLKVVIEEEALEADEPPNIGPPIGMVAGVGWTPCALACAASVLSA